MPASWSDCILDVSHNNGTVNWAAVPPQIVLVFVKASQGRGFHDPQFQTNRDGLAATGRLCVPYHFLTADDPDEQVENFLAAIDRQAPAGFMLDWEGRAAHTLPAEEVEYVGSELLAALALSNCFGYWGGPSSAPGKPTEAMRQWIKFTPRYPVRDAHSFEAIHASMHDLVAGPIWQYTQWGRVSGVAGDVDRSVFDGTPEALRKLAGGLAAPDASAGPSV